MVRARLIPVLSLAFVACGGGEELHAVWSDDGARYGLLRREWQPRDDGYGGTREYVAWSLELEDPATKQRMRAGAERTGAVAASPFYFMRSRGYFVVTSEDLRVAYVVGLDGSMRDLALLPDDGEGCPRAELMPSPDGALLARIRLRMNACLEHSSTTSVSVDVEMLDAETLEPAMATASIVMPRLPTATWTPGGALAFVASSWTDGCATTRALHVGEGFVAADAPGCTFPPTTSSVIGANGAKLDVHDGEVVVTPGQMSDAFGCQVRPSMWSPCETPAQEP